MTELFRCENMIWIRYQAIEKYSYAIPNHDALSIIKKYGPIVEIGSGSGYWAHLLK